MELTTSVCSQIHQPLPGAGSWIRIVKVLPPTNGGMKIQCTMRAVEQDKASIGACRTLGVLKRSSVR